MEGFWFGPGRELGHGIDLSEHSPNHFTGIVSLTEPFNLGHRSRKRVFSLRDGDVRKVFALLLQTMVMLEKLLTKELREALTTGAEKRPGSTRGIDAGQAILRGHLLQGSQDLV